VAPDSQIPGSDFIFRTRLYDETLVNTAYTWSPQESNIIGWDPNHVLGDPTIPGNAAWILLRMDTSAKYVKSNSRKLYEYAGNEWIQLPDFRNPKNLAFARFQDEPLPESMSKIAL
jgi:hypothetical protein